VRRFMDFQLPLSGSPLFAKVVKRLHDEFFQLPLSGSQSVAGVAKTSPPSPLSTPSLGITSPIRKKSGGPLKNTFNSLSRDHTRFTGAYLERKFAGLSTPSLGITDLAQKAVDATDAFAFNSLSRDHRLVPTGATLASVDLLSTPSLGITRATSLARAE